jgi:hypothetical protein
MLVYVRMRIIFMFVNVEVVSRDSMLCVMTILQDE